MSMFLDHVTKYTNKYIEKKPKSLRKKFGQFFTSEETATFMANLFNSPSAKTDLRILDAGAGSGVLSAALIEKLQKDNSIKHITLTCYENDPDILDVLHENLKWIKDNSKIQIDYEVKSENYILSQDFDYNGLIGANQKPEKYDMVIGNPPYMKIAKDAPEAKAMPDVCYGAPNLYFLFASMGVFNLKTDGEMVYIIPRSWTSGAYFKKFRKKFLKECILEHIHLFVSRDKVFDKESVLQETIIIKIKKTGIKPNNICITTSKTSKDFSNITAFKAPYDTVVSGIDKYVFLVTNSEEVDTIKKLNNWHYTLSELGIPMKTGLTVDFRNKDALRSKDEEKAVPLFYSQHIKNGKVIFPIGKEREYIVTNQSGLLQDNTNYLFVKRFTAKEERRRLQCGVYLSRRYPKYNKISTQNKINFIGGMKDLSECIIYGLYVLFNSTLYDSYYRILNGSTQVNSSEINSMPVPSLATIEEMGKSLIASRDISEQSCDKILRNYI